MKINCFEHKFVSRIPETLESGILYICLECNVIVHLCACGCGEKVVILIAPEHWHISYDGEGVSVYPSIGNSYFACRSHYFIKNDKVLWLEKMPIKNKVKHNKKTLFSYIRNLF